MVAWSIANGKLIFDARVIFHKIGII